MDKNDIIRANIFRAIKNAGISKLQVATRAKISYKYFIQFLNNNRGGSLGVDILQRIADVLNVPVSFILGEADAHGEIVYTSEGKQLPQKWDLTMKRIVNMTNDEQEKLFEMIDVILKNYHKK